MLDSAAARGIIPRMGEETGKWGDLAVRVLWAPQRAFRHVGQPGVLGICVALFLARWLVTPATTVLNLYVHRTPPLLPLPFGGDVAAYRAWELLWYAPYGLAVMLLVVWTVAAQMRRHGGSGGVRQVFQLVAIAYFAPWTLTAASDCLIIPAGIGMPYVMTATHLAALGWSTLLLASGLAGVCRLPPPQALRTAAVAAGMFILFGALVMR